MFDFLFYKEFNLIDPTENFNEHINITKSNRLLVFFFKYLVV